MDAPAVPTWLTTTELATPVCCHFGHDGASITDWTCHRLTGGGGEGLGVWRVAGRAMRDDSLQPWSLILKGWTAPGPSTAASAWNYSDREMEMHRSGLLDDLPGGIRVARCYGHTEHPDGSVWLWFEDITDDTKGRWPLDCYAIAARHLGQFNGAYLAERPLPVNPCLSHGWLRGWVEAAGPALAKLAKVSSHPLVRQVYPAHVSEVYTRLWAGRHTQYAMLDQLPQAFCHLDAFRRNLFLRQRRDGIDELVLIDWAFAGVAGVGEEVAPLVAGSVCFMEWPVEDARQLEAVVLDSYIEGLRDAGWRGDRELVGTGYAVAAGLRYGVGGVRILLPLLLDEQLHPSAEQLFGSPMTEIAVHFGTVNEWLAGLMSEV